LRAKVSGHRAAGAVHLARLGKGIMGRTPIMWIFAP